MKNAKTKIVFGMFGTAAIIGIAKLIAMASILSFVASLTTYNQIKVES